MIKRDYSWDTGLRDVHVQTKEDRLFMDRTECQYYVYQLTYKIISFQLVFIVIFQSHSYIFLTVNLRKYKEAYQHFEQGLEFANLLSKYQQMQSLTSILRYCKDITQMVWVDIKYHIFSSAIYFINSG